MTLISFLKIYLQKMVNKNVHRKNVLVVALLVIMKDNQEKELNCFI